MSEKVILRAEDLVKWIVTGVSWKHGTKTVSCSSTPPAEKIPREEEDQSTG